MSGKQFITFYLYEQLYGIDVSLVQEITRKSNITKVSLAPDFIAGLINLRGQIATAIDLKVLFNIEGVDKHKALEEREDLKNVICRNESTLLSFIVDEVGDVIEVEDSDFSQTPSVVDEQVQQFMKGIYKLSTDILCVLDFHKIINFLNK
mgnify:CR=1 FL=1